MAEHKNWRCKTNNNRSSKSNKLMFTRLCFWWLQVSKWKRRCTGPIQRPILEEEREDADGESEREREEVGMERKNHWQNAQSFDWIAIYWCCIKNVEEERGRENHSNQRHSALYMDEEWNFNQLMVDVWVTIQTLTSHPWHEFTWLTIHLIALSLLSLSLLPDPLLRM